MDLGFRVAMVITMTNTVILVINPSFVIKSTVHLPGLQK